MNKTVYRASQLSSTSQKQGLLPISPATLWRWSSDPKSMFPKPFKLGDGTTVWDASEIENYLSQCKGDKK